MALTKKPSQSTLSEAQTQALILGGAAEPERNVKPKENKAGRKKKPPVPQEEELIPTQLRLEPRIIDAIDTIRAKRIARISRHTWFLEAIAEKLQREGA